MAVRVGRLVAPQRAVIVYDARPPAVRCVVEGVVLDHVISTDAVDHNERQRRDDAREVLQLFGCRTCGGGRGAKRDEGELRWVRCPGNVWVMAWPGSETSR